MIAQVDGLRTLSRSFYFRYRTSNKQLVNTFKYPGSDACLVDIVTGYRNHNFSFQAGKVQKFFRFLKFFFNKY